MMVGTSDTDADNDGNAIGLETKGEAKARSRLVGDLPDGVGQRYFIEERGLRREQRLFENAHDDAPTIRDLGARLIAASESTAVVRDLIDIARHRGWETIDVSGTDRFRRLVEQEARDHGIEVSRPLSTARQPPRPSAPPPRAGTAGDRSPGDFRVGVTGVVVEIGEAPFNGRSGQRPSPYVDLKLDNGRIRRAWGAGLPAALAREQIEIGETILLRQNGSERGEGSKRPRKRWLAERQNERERAADRKIGSAPKPPAAPGDDRGRLSLGDRFRRSSPRERAEDPDLRAAQSQLVAAKALASAYFLQNPVAAALVAARVEGMIASSLDKGGRFGVARTRERGDGRQELVLDRSAERQRSPASSAKTDKHPEITKVRDRGRRR